MGRLRLAWSFLTGARSHDLRTLLASAVGIALSVTAVLFALSAPAVISEREAAARNRVAVSTEDSTTTPGLEFTTSTGLVHGRWLERVAVRGASPELQPPPGITTWPSPGQALVSPALATELGQDPSLAERLQLGEVLPTRISPDGLKGPDELYAYTILSDKPVPGGATAYGQAGMAYIQSPVPILIAELLLLVLLPGTIFAVLCLLHSARRREVRYRSLVLVGMTPRDCAKLYASEITFVAGAGVALGGAAFLLLQGYVGKTGLLGITWWPDTLTVNAFTIILGVVAMALVVFVVRRLAYVAMRHTLAQPPRRRASTERRSRWRQKLNVVLAWVCTAFLIAALGFFIWRIADTEPGVYLHANSLLYVISTAILLTSSVCLLVAVPYWTNRLFSRGAERQRWADRPFVGTSLTLITARWSALNRLVVAACAVILVSAMSWTFIGWLQATVSLAAGNNTSVNFELADVPAGGRAPLQVPEDVSVVVHAMVGSADNWVSFEAVRCATPDVPACELAGKVAPAARTTAWDVPLVDGSRHRLDLIDLQPDPALDFSWSSAVIDLDSNPWVWSTTDASVTLYAPRTSNSLDVAVGEVYRVAPTAFVQSGEDTELLALIDEQNFVLRLGVVSSIVFTAAAVLLAMWQLADATKRSRNALVACGVPQRFLRATNALTVSLPMGVAGLATAACMALGAWSMMSNFGTAYLDWRPLLWSFGPLLCLTAATAILAWATGGHRFDRTLAASE